ncbi:hypothetical protein NDU88_000562 [Pleurodeles waltl]|uniref:Uncharacterized protein n=1 Tax=Pleurodeles waltl TaxID=8319 RepID=A0AAV7S8I1_PLEWA|nr:hypothetical protein NDU88_000562 [Pleurodeles waltl]
MSSRPQTLAKDINLPSKDSPWASSRPRSPPLRYGPQVRPHHWTAALVPFASQGPQLQLQLTGGPTDPLTLSSLGSPRKGPIWTARSSPGPRLQAPTGPPAQAAPHRGGTAPSKGVAAPPAPSLQSIGPGLITQKSPWPPVLLSLRRRPGAPGSAHFGRSGPPPRARTEPPMPPRSQASQWGTSGRPAPHPRSKLRA